MFLLMCACPLKSKENVCLYTLVCAEHAGGCDYMYDDIDSLQSN